MRKAKGFSLIELTVVLVILGIVASAAVWRVEAARQRTDRSEIVGQVVAFDRLTRTYAREHDVPVSLEIHLGGGRLRRIRQDGEPAGEDWTLPDGYYFSRLLLPGEDLSVSEPAVGCSRKGFTPSYALRIEDRNGRSIWILFCGLSGKEILFEKETEEDVEEELEKIFKALAGRADVG